MASPPATLARRGPAGGSSASSWLLTVLGEFVLPDGGSAWTRALVHALGLVGVEEKAARQALARTARQGWLHQGRVGRRARWSLTDEGVGLLTEGARRIYSFGDAPARWDGRWLVLLVSVPESRRAARHRLRTRLSWAGFGSPEPGVWICPHTSHETEARAVLDELDLAAAAMSFRASFAGIGREQAMVGRAWDLDALAERYGAFVGRVAGQAPAPGDATLAAQLRLVHEWRGFGLADPQLPAELLPAGWNGARAAALFRDVHAAWQEPARARWREVGQG